MYKAKNIVICLDGTGNQIEENISNVLKIYRTIAKGKSAKTKHVVFYDQGVGTIGRQESWGAFWQKTKTVFGLVTGYGLDDNVLRAYEFIVRNYHEEDSTSESKGKSTRDNICIFGYSRGAHAARVLAALIYYLGVLKPEQIHLSGAALTALKRSKKEAEIDEITMFNRITQAFRPGIQFMGLWDTVSSVIVPRDGKLLNLSTESLLGTDYNQGVRVFRHAMSIDEARYMFRLDEWIEKAVSKRKVEIDDKNGGVQDNLQVWFAGHHGDVGGGNTRKDSGLSQYPLCWMIHEAMQFGIEFNTKFVNYVALGNGLSESTEHRYPEPDVHAKIHSSKNTPWAILEYLPKRAKYRECEGAEKRRSFLGLYIPRWEPRVIPKGANIHWSAIERRRIVGEYSPDNFPDDYEEIPHRGFPSKSWRPEKEND